jgi:hypothetical protein
MGCLLSTLAGVLGVWLCGTTHSPLETSPTAALTNIKKRKQSTTSGDKPETRDVLNSPELIVSETKAAIFRIMDLPQEVRNIIFTFAFATKTVRVCHDEDHESRQLSCFKVPPLAQVSRQIRADSLPIFFSTSKFDVYVNSNLADRVAARNGEHVARTPYGRKQLGRLVMQRRLMKRLYNFRSVAIFRDVTFNVRPFEHCHHSVWERSLDVVVYVRVQFLGAAGVKVTLCRGRNVEFYRRYPGFEMKDTDDMFREVRAAAETIAKSNGFKGFKIHHLEDLARLFRFKRS